MGVIEEYEKFKKHGGGISEYSKLLNKCIKELKKKDEELNMLYEFVQRSEERLADILSKLDSIEKKTEELLKKEELMKRLIGED